MITLKNVGENMKKKDFWTIFVFIVALLVASSLLESPIGTLGYVLSIVLLTAIYNYKIFPQIKAMYRAFKAEDKYRKHCTIFLITCFIIGTIGLIYSLIIRLL